MARSEGHLAGMRLLLLSVAALLLPVSNLPGQQTSLAFSQSIGIQRAQMRSVMDTAQRDTVPKLQRYRPSPAPYVVAGALIGGVAGGLLLAHKITESLQHGGEWLGGWPTIGIAKYVGGGLVVGGIFGVIVYAIDNR